MKKLILAGCLLVFSASMAKAQEVTDEQVWKYALMTEVINQMKSELSKKVNETIKAQEGMTGQRYKELAGGAAAANDFETQFMASINKMTDKRKKAIKTVNSNLATKMLGSADIYKAVKAAVKGDMKAKYEEYKAQIAFGASS